MTCTCARPCARLRQVVGGRGGEEAGDLAGAEVTRPHAGAPLERHRRAGALQVRHQDRTLDTSEAASVIRSPQSPQALAGAHILLVCRLFGCFF